MDSSDILAAIAPFQSELVACVLEGWDGWDPEEYPPRRNPTLRANVVNAWIWGLAETKLGPYGFERVEEGGQPYMILGSSLRVRFKKMDSLGVSANVQTKQQRNLRKYGVPSEQMSFNLNGFNVGSAGETTYLEVGYVLDPAEERVERVLLVARGKSGWTHELWVAGQKVVNASRVAPKQAPAAPPATAKLKPQRKSAEKGVPKKGTRD